MREKIGFYAGSFDPFTNGHLHVITQAAKVFDKLIIGIGINANKKRRYDEERMKHAIEKVLKAKSLINVSVVIYNALTVDIALEYGATFLIRGIRNGIDYGYEENIASFNEEISGIDTIYFRAGNLGNISSSFVMELLNRKKDVSKYLPEEILELILVEDE